MRTGSWLFRSVHRLLQDQSWASVFRSAAPRITQINVRLLALRAYLQAVYDAQVKTNPAEASFLDCPACHFKALNPQTGHAYFDSECLVCGFKELSHHAVTPSRMERRSCKGIASSVVIVSS